MAKRKFGLSKKKPSELKIRIQKHISILGLKSVEEYEKWCLDGGFKFSVNKSSDEITKEKEHYFSSQEKTKSRIGLHRNLKKLIQLSCDNKINPDEIDRPVWVDFCEAITKSDPSREARKSLKALLLRVNAEAGFIVESTTFGNHTFSYIRALIRINNRRSQWIRPLEKWKINSHNRRRQFSSLVRHLFAKYAIPTFLDSVWFRYDKGAYRYRDWFIHIGLGMNIRKAKTQIPLTKKMSHYFLEAPDDYTVENALRWGQIHSLGGDKRLTESILATNLGETFVNDDFWQTVIRFFIRHPLLERKYVGPIVDYLQAQKFTTEEVLVGPGTVEIQPPPKPNLSMRGRNPGTLLKEVEKWHSELGCSASAKELFFKRSGIKEYQQISGPKSNQRIWKIIELLSGAALIKEGKTMNHCIASYANSCAKGQCSIWSMQLVTREGTVKRQTIEVSNHGVILESRGKNNRWPTSGEFEILNRWAQQQDLTLSKYILVENI